MVMMMDCIFCKIIKGDIPSYKIYEDENILAFLDLNQECVGHTLVIPKVHTLDINSITDDDLMNVMAVAKNIAMMITNKLGAQGFTLMQNNGICQDVKHFHLHVIPKYNKKINLSIEEVYKKITQ